MALWQVLVEVAGGPGWPALMPGDTTGPGARLQLGSLCPQDLGQTIGLGEVRLPGLGTEPCGSHREEGGSVCGGGGVGGCSKQEMPQLTGRRAHWE